MSILLGLDVGTSGARVLAINEQGAVIAEASSAYPLATPFPGWSEQDPADWWRGAREALRSIAAQVGRDVVGLGLTGQMHGSVFLDEAEQVIRPALLWNDQRTAVQCQTITERIGQQRLLEIAGNPALTGFQAPKILWLRDNEPANYTRIRRVLLPKDYVRLLLTGDLATDASDASGTLLLDVQQRNWSPEILEKLEIPHQWLPPVYEGPAITGHLRKEVAEALGLPAGIPVAAGGGDNAAAAIGTGIIGPGLLSSSIGTSGVLFAHAEEFRQDPSGRIHAFCHAVPEKYHLMAVTLAAGGALQWWRNTLGTDTSYDQLSELAASAPPGAEGLLFLPYLSGERTPHLDPTARGSFFGLTVRHTKAHMTRAVMEGVVFSLRDGLEIIKELGVTPQEVRATGGGARGLLWRQLQADIYNLPVRRTVADEGPTYGAALLAGIAAGLYKDVAEACGTIRLRSEITEPDPQRVQLYDQYYDVYRSVYPASATIMHQLAELSGAA